MSHELEMVGGRGQMFSVREMPWHKLGVVLDSPPTVLEGIKKAGLDWTVRLEPLFTAKPNAMGAPHDITDKQAPSNAVVRESDNSILGVVGSSYRPLQNIQAFEWFQPFLDEKVASLESAGSLYDGKKIWVLAKINAPDLEVVRDDLVEQFILLSNSHDGTTAIRLGFTPVRVVCNNTLTMAHDGASKLIRVYHQGNVKENINLVREVMSLTNREFEATVEQYRRLARMPISEASLKQYVTQIFRPVIDRTFKPDAIVNESPAVGDYLPDNGKIMTTIQELFETGMGNDMPDVRGTKWAAYNAVVEYLQYRRGENEQSRFGSLWFKDGRRYNQKALDLALAV